MTDPTFNTVTISQDAGAARADLLTIDSVTGADGNGGALRFVNNSAGALGLTIGRLGVSRVDASTVRLELGVAADPSLSSGDSTPALLSLEKGTGAPRVSTPASATLAVGGSLSVAGAATLSNALTVTGATTLNGGLAVSGALTATGTVNGRNIATDGGRLDGHLASTANPHGTTAAQVGALALSGGTLSGALGIAGNLTIGAGSSATLSVRHIDGKDYRNDNPDALFLNWGTSQPVYVGFGNNTQASLFVSGNLGVGIGPPERKLHVKGNAGVLALEGSDHVYLELYPDGFGAGRKAWLGYSNVSDNNLSIASEIAGANLNLITNGGGVWTNGTLTVQGDITLTGQKFYSPGRMHIHGEELLYLLNKSGVVISNAWGGNGNLTVQGNIQLDGQLNKLDVAHGFEAFIRCADFNLGAPDRRGAPGRALVDNGTTLVVNFGPDWPLVHIDGHVRARGSFSSTRKIKEEIASLSLGEATDVVMELDPVAYWLKAARDEGRQLGFIAEEVPAAVGTPDREAISPTGILAAAIKVIQEQQRRLATLEARLP